MLIIMSVYSSMNFKQGFYVLYVSRKYMSGKKFSYHHGNIFFLIFNSHILPLVDKKLSET